MVSPQSFIESLRAGGIDFFTGVPDSLLKNVCAYITDTSDPAHNIIAPNEGSAVALAAGHYLATGSPALVYMQNSGIGNAVNPLLSLADEKVYSIPMLLLIGWRGEPGVHDEPQHVKQGEVTLPLLEAMGIDYAVMPESETEAIAAAERMVGECRRKCRPCALVVRKGSFGPYKLIHKPLRDFPLGRESAMKIVVDALPEDAAVVSTTGKLSRELFEYREASATGHARDFLTVGSMGHASSIALAIALAHLERKIVCFDGDGAYLMHSGILANIGALAPANFVHVLFNNGAHESVGGQPTLGLEADAPAMAVAAGYRSAVSVEREEEILRAVSEALASEGPSLIEIKVRIESRENLGRPTTTPLENKEQFMKFLNNGD